jgi:hypothetical protein
LTSAGGLVPQRSAGVVALFQEILSAFVDDTQDIVRFAVLCDGEGERIAAAHGAMAAYDVDVFGATFAATILPLARGARLRVRFDSVVAVVVVVDLGCYLVVACSPGYDAALRERLEGVVRALIEQF